MSTDGLRRVCPKCGGSKIQGPTYLPEDHRAKLECLGCGFWWTRPTHDQTQYELMAAQNDRTKSDD